MNVYKNAQSLNNFRTPVNNATSPTGMTWEGKVYRGRRMDIKSTDPQKNKPRRSLQKPRAKVFNMEDATDVKEYQKVMADTVHNKVHIGAKQMLLDRNPFCIYMEWYEDVYVAPEGNNDAPR